jgi:hypothetical protein
MSHLLKPTLNSCIVHNRQMFKIKTVFQRKTYNCKYKQIQLKIIYGSKFSEPKFFNAPVELIPNVILYEICLGRISKRPTHN